MKTLIKNGIIVNEGRSFKGNVIIDNDKISDITETTTPCGDYDLELDATGCFVLPGVIDTHVHFREPGLTHKADIESESKAAAYGGVTTYFDMPNTNPQTTTIEAWMQKRALAAEKSHVNYAIFFGATNDNTSLFHQLDQSSLPGIKLFMGSSTGNMLVDKDEALKAVFGEAKRLNLPVMAHCEDTDIINDNMQKAKALHPEGVPIEMHPAIRSAEACMKSSQKAAELAASTGAHLHLAHVTTKDELQLASSQVTLEATVAHLLFTDADYKTRGARIKCNPAVKTESDREALRKALMDGRITTIGTDHAPHAMEEKQGGADKAASGMPMLQFSLPSMLGLYSQGVLSMERLVELMAHNPAQLFRINDRGFLRKGYKADIVIVREEPFEVTKDEIQSKCKWSPIEGTKLMWRVKQTFCNGHLIYNNNTFQADARGEEVRFDR